MKVIWEPQPKQSLALQSDADEILYGGARGGGKTDAGIMFPLYNIQEPRFRALVIRKNSTDLGDWIDRADHIYRNQGGVRKMGQFGIEFTFPTGAKIRTGHLQDDQAYTKYQGHEYQNMIIEELSQISREKDYLKLKGSCRSTINVKPQTFCTTNPDEPGLDWIKKRFQIPDYPDFDKIYERLIPTSEGNIKLVFIPAKLEDNPILMKADPKYLQYLESLKEVDPELYDAWRKGNWMGYGVEGSYYREHVARAEADGRIREGIFDPLVPVDTWCDLGVADSFAIWYVQRIHNQSRVIDYDEFDGESLGDAINRMNQKGYVYRYHYAPHDIAVRELTSGKSRREIALQLGVNYRVVPRPKMEQEKINALRMRFGELVFDKKKTELLLRRLKNYHKEWDEKRGIWKDKPYHDINSHGADAGGYWALTSTPDNSVQRTKERRPAPTGGLSIRMTNY